MAESPPIHLTIPEHLGGIRLDQALQQMLPEHSRSRLQLWIKTGRVVMNQAACTAKTKVWGGEKIQIQPQALPEQTAFQAEDIALDLVYEDDHLLVVNKPPGMVVHPAAGNWQGTLLNALLHHHPAAAALPRAGIVHRLDKDTSGLLVVAKTLAAQTSLVRQLQERTVKREYRAIVWGQVWQNGKVDQPIGRDPRSRTRMAIRRTGKPAMTHYEVLERFAVHTYLRCQLETGRTHQIRVHLQSIKAPIVGDPVYGYRGIVPTRLMNEPLRAALDGLNRQALHAIKLGLIHPHDGEPMSWQIDLAEDMKHLLETMRLVPEPENSELLDFGVGENGLYIGDDEADDWTALDDEDFDDEDLNEEIVPDEDA